MQRESSECNGLNKKISKILGKRGRVVIFDIEKCSTSCRSGETQELVKIKKNMKEKSLEELSKRFMQMLLERSGQHVSLEEVSEQLGVERRKIYDIINIMESIRLITRQEKNAIRLQTLSSLEAFIHEVHHSPPLQKQARKEKQLEYLAQGFIRLFRTNDLQVSLEKIALTLATPEQKASNQQHLKTRVRRLYDIANVFKSIGLVSKVKLENNKPGYAWEGMDNIYKIVRSECQYRATPEKKDKLWLFRQFCSIINQGVPDKENRPIILQKSHELMQNHQTPLKDRTLLSDRKENGQFCIMSAHSNFRMRSVL